MVVDVAHAALARRNALVEELTRPVELAQESLLAAVELVVAGFHRLEVLGRECGELRLAPAAQLPERHQGFVGQIVEALPDGRALG
ncbi:hypothetical protein AEGHOMDF_0765 [Methylobacterium soli]|nr:hypothetical protein AEGHOMDF_0765 [Methylobacterium soli]